MANAEDDFFCTVQLHNVHGIIIVIGKGFHVIEQNPIHDENRKPDDELSTGSAGHKTNAKQCRQNKLIAPGAYQKMREQ
jgi:hypothetical protein